MAFSAVLSASVEKTIKQVVRNKLNRYRPEPAVMPFHTRLLGRDRMALYSFIHSLNTNFGTSIFEPVAAAVAQGRFHTVEQQRKMEGKISASAQMKIQTIMDNLTVANQHPNKLKETEIIRRVCRRGKMRKVKATRADLYLETESGEIYLFDIKTAKPNRGGFKEYKRTLMEWSAIILAENPNAVINGMIAIPYNPYSPKPYSRWTMAGMLDLQHELKVAEEFWDFLGGEGVYEDLLNCFERAGLALREDIDGYFLRFNSEN